MSAALTGAAVVVLILLAWWVSEIYSWLRERRRKRRIRLRYAVLGAYMAGNRLATMIASALELHVSNVYAALAELETRGLLTTAIERPEPSNNRSPSPTAALPDLQQLAATERDARRRSEGAE